MRRGAALALLVLASGCARGYVRGPLELSRAEAGEVFVEAVELGPDRSILRGAVVLDVPPWQALNLYADLEGMPAWHAMFSDVRVTRRDGEVAEALFWLKPMLGRTVEPMAAVARVDRERMELSITAFENDWLRASQTLIKAERLDADGRRTLLTGYSTADTKVFGASLTRGGQEDRLAQALRNAREAARLPRYAIAPAARPGPRRGKVLVPAFAASDLPPEASRYAAHALAEQLMRGSRWDVVTDDETAALLVHESRRQLLGCDAAACGADLAKAFDAERIVAGRIGRVGERLVATVSVLRYPEGVVESRFSAEAGDVAALVDRLRAAAEGLGRP